MSGISSLGYVSITRPCFEAVEKVLEAFSDTLTSQKEVDEALGHLEKVWQAEKERKARSARQVQDDAKARGSKPGRRAIELPSGEALRVRLQTIGIGKLAKELGCSAPTIRKRIHERIIQEVRKELGK